MQGPASWRVAVTVPAALAELVGEALGDTVSAVSVFGEEEAPTRLVEGFGAAKPDRAALAVRLALLARARGVDEPELAIERIPPTDWLAASYQAFPPIRVGRFHIHGSHEPGEVPAGAIGLCIDAATAFGTGEHPTTAGCLTALEQLAKRRGVGRALDMGCGSGILAFAVARLWHTPVLAVDVDAESVRVARHNARLNRVAGLVRAARGDGYASRAVAGGGPYDLIVANILARPLAAMAKDLSAHLAPGGTAILAGLLERQQAQVLAAHRAQGLVLVGRVRAGIWPTLILAKRHASTAETAS
ncbi:MAG: 50S ribosomal protein L11 methyltransferase [Inquilinus sp.]|nr:50S ribosomal protein L11 methyltransferase [Inquilinus sp.]